MFMIYTCNQNYLKLTKWHLITVYALQARYMMTEFFVSLMYTQASTYSFKQCLIC